MFQSRRDAHQRIDALARIPFLATCTPNELARIDRLGAPVDVRPGRTLTREGARGRECFVTLGGVAIAARAGRRVAAVGAGSILGELALLDGATRTATVVASTPMELLVLTDREFKELLEIAPGVAIALRHIAEQRRAALGATSLRCAA